MKSRSKKISRLLAGRRKTVLGLALTVAIIILVLELTNTTHIFHSQNAVSGTISSTSPAGGHQANNQSARRSSSASSANGSTNESAKATSATSDSTAPLVDPYGSFVSNHKPSLSGAGGVPSQEESVCTTTPGASCAISFSQNGVTKNLTPQIANGEGTVIWDWDVKKAGFTTGSWSITATATLNGDSKSTKDGLDLVVSP